jgi:hypothetical protein
MVYVCVYDMFALSLSAWRHFPMRSPPLLKTLRSEYDEFNYNVLFFKKKIISA